MPEIVTTKDEKENAVLKMIDERVVHALTDRRTIETVRKATGKDPVDPRNQGNYRAWLGNQGAYPIQLRQNEPENAYEKAWAKAVVKGFLGEEGSDREAATLRFLEGIHEGNKDTYERELPFEATPALVKAGLLVPGAKGKGYVPVNKTAEVTTTADLRTVAGTEYDPEIYAFPTLKVDFEDLLDSSPIEKGEVDFLQEYGYSGSGGYGLIPGNNAAAVLEVDDPASPLTLTDSTVAIVKVRSIVANIRTKISVASELIDDIPALRAHLEMRITSDIKYATSAELASGSGTAPHLLGFYIDPLCQAYAWSSGAAGDTQADAILQGIILSWLAEHEPDNIPMAPQDWGAIIKLKNSIQSYLIPSAHTKDNAKTLWGLDVLPTTANPAGYAMPGSWKKSAKFRDRQATSLFWTRFYGTDLDSNILRLFANRRCTVQRTRPEGFTAVHFDAAPAGS